MVDSCITCSRGVFFFSQNELNLLLNIHLHMHSSVIVNIVSLFGCGLHFAESTIVDKVRGVRVLGLRLPMRFFCLLITGGEDMIVVRA
jgi:hypothetical protein